MNDRLFAHEFQDEARLKLGNNTKRKYEVENTKTPRALKLLWEFDFPAIL
jgi:hypothetical protein